jgi:hypothetical protein
LGLLIVVLGQNRYYEPVVRTGSEQRRTLGRALRIASSTRAPVPTDYVVLLERAAELARVPGLEGFLHARTPGGQVIDVGAGPFHDVVGPDQLTGDLAFMFPDCGMQLRG